MNVNTGEQTRAVLNVFEAKDGDFMWLQYSARDSCHHVIIDSGGLASRRDYKRLLEYIKGKDEPIDLVVFTHVDADHIAGGLSTFSELKADQLPVIQYILINTLSSYLVKNSDNSQLSIGQEVKLESILKTLGLQDHVFTPVYAGLCIELDGGGCIKIVSPGQEQLKEFEATNAGKIKEEEKKIGAQLSSGAKEELEINISDYLSKPDISEKRMENKVGIAFVFEYKEIKLAFLADADADICVEGLKRFYPTGINLDLVKLSHHGSSNNTSRKLLRYFRTDQYLLSTNGHGGKPGKQALSRMIENRKPIRLFCNYQWWRDYYTGKYFTDEDKIEYLDTGILSLIYLKEQLNYLDNGLSLRLRRANSPI